MDEPIPGKSVSNSRISLSQLMQPEHSNMQENVHGGWIMKLMDEAGALACMRHARSRVVTVAVDQMTFRQPIRVGDLVTITAEVSYVGHTSMEAEVNVVAENPITGGCTFTNTGYIVYVSLDDAGHPAAVPALIPETESQRNRMQEGKVRQAYRLSQAHRVEQKT